jgi:hypothetical protein
VEWLEQSWAFRWHHEFPTISLPVEPAMLCFWPSILCTAACWVFLCLVASTSGVCFVFGYQLPLLIYHIFAPASIRLCNSRSTEPCRGRGEARWIRSFRRASWQTWRPRSTRRARTCRTLACTGERARPHPKLAPLVTRVLGLVPPRAGASYPLRKNLCCLFAARVRLRNGLTAAAIAAQPPGGDAADASG